MNGLWPQDCSWGYKQYKKRSEIFKEVNKSSEHVQYFSWLPERGYLILLGKLIFLFDDYDTFIGYYVDKDDWTVFYRNKQLKAEYEQNWEKAYIELFFAGEAMSAYFGTSFVDLQEDKVDNTYLYLTDEQIRRIK